MLNLDKHFFLTYKEEINISLFITSSCNLSCSYCIAGDVLESTKEIKYIDEKFIESFTNFLLMCNSRNINLKIVGGEPLLNKKNLLKLLESLLTQNIVNNIYITTNAIYLDKKFLLLIKRLNGSNKIKFKISYDGPSSLSRGGLILNRNVLKKIYLIKKVLGSKSLIIASVISSENFSSFYQNLIFILRYIKPNELMYGLAKGGIWDDEKIKILKKDYLKLYLSYKKEGFSTKLDLGKIEDIEIRPCSKGLDHFITYEGFFYPCYSFLRGNYLHQKFTLTLNKIKTEEDYNDLLLWGKEFYKEKTSLGKADRRIDFSHCFYTKLKGKSLTNTLNNITQFSLFKKQCYEKFN